MKNAFKKYLRLAFVITSLSSAAQADSMIRFWKGYQRADLNTAQFLQTLNHSLIPATAALGTQRTSLEGYLPVVTAKSSGPAQIPAELALVVYGSEEKYKAFRATAPGQAYSDLHWDLFDKSKSGSAVAQRGLPAWGALKIGDAMSLTGYKGRWDQGHARFTMIRRHAPLDEKTYLARTWQWLRYFNNEGMDEGQGHLARVVLVEKDYIAAYDLWSDRESYETRNDNNMDSPDDFADQYVHSSGLGKLWMDIELTQGLPFLQNDEGLQAPLAP